jgi:hypothetical protein
MYVQAQIEIETSFVTESVRKDAEMFQKVSEMLRAIWDMFQKVSDIKKQHVSKCFRNVFGYLRQMMIRFINMLSQP